MSWLSWSCHKHVLKIYVLNYFDKFDSAVKLHISYAEAVSKQFEIIFINLIKSLYVDVTELEK